MNSATELDVTAKTSVFPQNNLARWYKATSSARHAPEAGLNTLVDCSATAFEHIYLLTQSPLTHESKKTIEEYLESLQKHYQHLGYSHDISLAAHYVVCATLDDMLRCTGNDGQFLQNFHNSRLDQEKFYSILDHISPQADKYIDLLELMYLCLRFGYKGQYRNTPFGLQQWSLLTDNTYRLITDVRGQRGHHLSPSLSPVATPLSKALPLTTQRTSPIAAKKQHHFYLIAILLFIFFAVAAGFVFRETYNATRDVLTKSANPISQKAQKPEIAT